PREHHSFPTRRSSDLQVEFLREIVKVPSDTPPGDNAPAAEKAAALLTAMNFRVERHPVSDDFLRGYGMRSVTNLIVRQRFGSGRSEEHTSELQSRGHL